MSKKSVKEFSPKFKVKVVLEALREEETTSQLASRYEINPRNIQNWRKQFIENAEIAFNNNQMSFLGFITICNIVIINQPSQNTNTFFTPLPTLSD